MLSLVFTLASLGIVATMIIRGVDVFLRSTGTWSERLLATSKESATWFVGKVLWIGGWIVVGADNLALLLGQDTVAAFVRDSLPPQWAGWGLVTIAVVVWLARYRTLFSK